jgi:hypothetical protein
LNSWNQPQDIARLLVEAAERCKPIASVEEANDISWIVTFEEGAGCLVELADAPPRLVLMGEIGQPAADMEVQTYKTALQFNSLWEPAAGARVGMGLDDGALLLFRDLQPETLRDGRLEDHLVRFEALRMWWSLFIQTKPGTPARELTRLELLGLLA